MTAVSKVTLNGTTLMDATTATATASEILESYTAMLADGVMTTGTASGGGGGEGLRLLQTVTANAVNGVRIDINPAWFTAFTYVMIVPDLTYSASDWMYVVNDSTSGGQYTGGSWAGLNYRYSVIIRTTTSGYYAVWFKDETGVGVTANYSVTEYLYWHLYVASKTMTGTFKIYGVPLKASGDSKWTTDGIASKTEPNGAITISSAVGTILSRAFSGYTGITEVTIEGDPYIGLYAFENCPNLETLNTPNLTKLKSGYYGSSTYTFQNCPKLKGVVFPSYSNNGIDSYVFQKCTALTYADFNDLTKLGGADVFSNTGLNVLVIRRTSGVATLQSGNNFTKTPFASDGTGGTLYVPSALISDYQSATNWSTMLGYTNNQILPIEGSYYETHYADGTVIE